MPKENQYKNIRVVEAYFASQTCTSNGKETTHTSWNHSWRRSLSQCDDVCAHLYVVGDNNLNSLSQIVPRPRQVLGSIYSIERNWDLNKFIYNQSLISCPSNSSALFAYEPLMPVQ